MISCSKNISRLNAFGSIIMGVGMLTCDMCVAENKIPPVSGESAAGFAIHVPNPKPPPDSVQRHDLRNESLQQWRRHEIVSENSIRVFFAAGTRSCYGNRVVLKETSEEVQIAIIEGTVPEHPGMCTLNALLTSFLLHTEKAIAGRKIVPLRDVELKK